MAGTLDNPTGLTGVAHIYADDKGDYYELDRDLPRHANGEHGIATPGVKKRRANVTPESLCPNLSHRGFIPDRRAKG